MQKRDCRGLACPKPVLVAKEAIDSHPDEVLEIQVDNVASRENVSRFLKSQGWEIGIRDEAGGVFVITGAPPTCSLSFPEPGKEAGERQKILVLIGSDALGNGSDELGRGLMKNFLSTLNELGSDLWRIVCVNNGVKLAVSGAPCLDELRSLSAAGVDILVCGTCLEHFGLLDAKEVGVTTNMLDIVTSLHVASKVIRI